MTHPRHLIDVCIAEEHCHPIAAQAYDRTTASLVLPPYVPKYMACFCKCSRSYADVSIFEVAHVTVSDALDMIQHRSADLERLEALQLLQRQVKQLIVEGVGSLAIVLALAEHVWQQQLVVGEAQGLGLGLLGVVVLLTEAKLGGVVQRRRQGSSQPA